MGSRSPIRDPDRYQILGEHGRGGLGRVSRAHDRDLGRDVAIKELISRGHVSEVRFLREALITARLEHPGIVPVHEAGRWPDGTPFYAMKLVSGRPLRELIAERSTVEQRVGLLHHVIAVADAIAYAHGRNIIHRDLKPANIIVGDFGETIVIDWGLAKDLTATEESAVAGGPFRTMRDSDLTAAGSVLGTPTYMAPEQERGEHVDQRADVFAIGAMLWELCALQKVPPTDTRHRNTMLRRAGIDKDLATIIDKALDPDPQRRYRDAGALAADLKAFKSGARIAARTYSLFAMLAHWTRRHRTLAFSVTAAVVLAAAGSAIFVQNIAAQRDRADNALERVEAGANQLILKQAELLLHVDPTAASDVLETYHGGDALRLAMLRAQARGLGVAHLRAAPHSDNVFLARPLSDGTILTLGRDNIIAKTTEQGLIRVIAHNMGAVFSYSESTGLLAYACRPAAICILEANTERQLPVASDMASFSPSLLAFSPGGDTLAAMSRGGNIALWSMTGGAVPVSQYQGHVPTGDDLVFVDDQTLAVVSRDHVGIFRLSPSHRSLVSTSTFPVEGATSLVPSAERQMLAITTDKGDLLLVDARNGDLVEQRTLCSGAMNNAVFMQHGALLGYACQEGNVGVWNVDGRVATVLTHMDGGSSLVASRPDGKYLLAGSNNGKLFIYDLETKISTFYLGHISRIMELSGPSSMSSYIVSADSGGKVRIWPLPRSGIKAIIQSPARLITAILLSNTGPVIASRADSSVPVVGLDGKTDELPGHDPTHIALAFSDIEHVAFWGQGETIERWSFGARPAQRLLKTNHGSVTAVRYLAGNRLVTAGDDGAVIEWSADAESQRQIAVIHEPVRRIAALPSTDSMIVFGASGSLWRVDHEGSRFIEKLPGSLRVHAVSRDDRLVVVGTSEGLVRLYDTRTLEARTLAKEPASIKDIAFSATGQQVAVVANGVVSILNSNDHQEERETNGHLLIPWTNLDTVARGVAFSANGDWVAITCDGGMIWLYAIHEHSWVNLSVSTGDVFTGYFSDDSLHFLSTDSSGQATLVDMRSIRSNL